METNLRSQLESLRMEWEIKANGLEDAFGENDPIANIFRACARDLHHTVHHEIEGMVQCLSLQQH